MNKEIKVRCCEECPFFMPYSNLSDYNDKCNAYNFDFPHNYHDNSNIIFDECDLHTSTITVRKYTLEEEQAFQKEREESRRVYEEQYRKDEKERREEAMSNTLINSEK